MNALLLARRLMFEALEGRTLLDGAFGSTTPSVVVGRTLSSYTVSGVAGNQETITYTVYNEQADPETGVLLTTSLQPGVTFASASVLPDRSGQDLAWSLGTIAGYDRASVSLNVTLATPTPLQLDGGAKAYAFLDGGLIGGLTPAATLSTLAVPAGTLDSTPDANTTDPFIQEEAAKLLYNPQLIFDFLHTQIGYNSYNGSVRGARGTLWSDAGNALDVASLGVALMRASGLPAEYLSGTLSGAQAQSLILSMFPASYQTVGYIPSGTTTSDPADDSQLLSEAENHDWFQFNAGSGLQAADPLIVGATLGQTFASPTGTFTEVPDALREKTEIHLNAEIYSQAGAAFGLGDGISTSTVLDHVFNDVDLVGKPLTVGHMVTTNGVGALALSLTTNVYSPYLIVGDEAYPDSSHDQRIEGTNYQEIVTNFPLGSQLLTGLFLDITSSGPVGASSTSSRTLFDRIGPAARSGQGSTSLTADPDGQPAISPLDLDTIEVLAGQHEPAASSVPPSPSKALDAVDALSAQYAQATPDGQDSLSANLTTALRNVLVTVERARLETFELQDALATDSEEKLLGTRSYADLPNLFIVSSKVVATSTGGSALQLGFDIRRSSDRVIVSPGQNLASSVAFRVNLGFAEDALEGSLFALPTGTPPPSITVTTSTTAIFQAAQLQGIAIATILPGDAAALDALPFTPDIKAQLLQAIDSGQGILIPSQAVQIGGQATVGWFQVSPSTGATVGVLADGTHGAFDEFVATRLNNGAGPAERIFLGALSGFVTSSAIQIVVRILLNPLIPGGYIGVASNLKSFVSSLLSIRNLPEVVQFTLRTDYFFGFGWAIGTAAALQYVADPEVPAARVDPHPFGPQNAASLAGLAVAPSLVAGTASGSLKLAGIQVAGTLSASWTVQGTSSYQVAALTSSAASVVDASGSVIGVGPVSLAVSTPIPTSVLGNVNYVVSGQGSLAFEPPSSSGLAVSGDWSSYLASLTGVVMLQFRTDGLMLNGKLLPAGTYTVSTGNAMIAGSGAGTSADFSSLATINATNSTVNLGPSAGKLIIGGTSLDPTQGVALAGFSGLLALSDDHNVDISASLNGLAANVLAVSTSASTLAANPDARVSFTALVHATLGDSYTIKALAPAGWTVVVDASGRVSVTPASGTAAGNYPIDVTVQSTLDPDLVAQSVVEVAVTPTSPGLTLSVAPDPVFYLPYGGAHLPTAFRASVDNLGPSADTYHLSFSGVPTGFTLLDSGTSVIVPAGQTGFLGLYLQPNAGQPLPAAGTILTFTVTATSATTSTITRTQVVTFTVPAIDAVTVTSDPTSVNTIPGLASTTTITITNVGNVSEAGITLEATTSTGLTLAGLSSATLGVGQSKSETVTLTPAASVSLGSLLEATITATYGASASTTLLSVPLDVVVPGALAIADASSAASQLGDSGLADRLNDLSTAITSLVQDPTGAVANSRSIGDLDAIAVLLGDDAFLAPVSPTLVADGVALSGATTAATVLAALAKLNIDLSAVNTTLNDEVEHDFTLSLLVNSQVASPQVPRTFAIALQNTGDATTTYDLSLSGLPAGVTASFSAASVTLGAGQSTTDAGRTALTLTLTSTSSSDVPAFSFQVVATAEGAPEIARSTTGSLEARAEVVSVVSVATNPPFTEPGGTVDVTARILNAVNSSQAALVFFRVEDSSGTTLYQSPYTQTTLQILTTITTVDLGSFSTKGFVDGIDTISVIVADASGTAFAGTNATGSLQVGSPVTATQSVTPDNLAIASGTVTNSVTVALDPNATAPLGLVGQVSPAGGATSVAIDGNLAYVGSSTGINIVDVSNPASPTAVGNFGSADIPANSYIYAKVSGNELVVETSLDNLNPTLLIYSLADPLHPALLGQTLISNDYLLEGFALSDNHAYFYSHWVRYYLASGTIFQQHGEIISVDISDPAHPTPTGIVYNQPPDGGSGFPDGDSNIFDNLPVDSNTLLAGSTTTTMGTLTGTGEVLIVDTSNPSAPALVNTLMIPGTTFILSLAPESGNRVLVVGSTGGYNSDDSDLTFGPTGNLVLITLDISDPRNPKILSTQELAEPSHAAYNIKLVPLGGDKFLFSSEGVLPEQPAFFFVDASGPGDAVVTSLTTPTYSVPYDVTGGYLYSTSDSGLLIYKIGTPTAETPVTVDVLVPNDTGATIVPGSFNIAPTAIIPGVVYDTIEWQLNLDQATTSRTFTYQTMVTGLQAGVSLPVTLQTKVTFTSQGTPGRFTLAPLSVAGQQILGIFPSSLTSLPGQPASYFLRLENPSPTDETFDLSVEGVPASWVNLPAKETVPAGGEEDFHLTLTSAATTSNGTYGFSVMATAEDGTTGLASSNLILQGQPIEPDPQSHGIAATLVSSMAAAGQGTSAHYVLRLTNTGSSSDTFSYQLAPSSFVDGLTATFGESTIVVPPGVGNFRDVPLTLTPTEGDLPSVGNFTVLVRSTTDSGVMTSTVGLLDILSEGVSVTLNPSSSAPGGPFELTVTNTGSATDTFNLNLFGPAALVSSLASTKVTLAPGASEVVPIATSAVDFAVQGSLGLTAVATSEANNAAQAVAESSLAIPATTGMTAQLTPGVQVLAIPGTTSFLLIVTNSGNVEDSYSATLIATAGPIRANLLGLDGLPTSSVPIFRIPGLSTAEIVVQADLLGVGLGALSVQVRSLTDASEVATETATVSSTPATMIQLIPPVGPLTAGLPATITAIVTSAGSLIPSGVVTFLVDGVAQSPEALAFLNGQAVATLTSTFGAGVHHVSASFGSLDFSASSTGPIAFIVNSSTIQAVKVATGTVLVASPNPVPYGQPASFVAIVVPSSGLATPTGSVEFFVDGVAQPPVSLQPVAGGVEAVLTLATLSPGQHAIQAIYLGDSNFDASTSAAVSLAVSPPVVVEPPAFDGPRIVGIQRIGYHASPTSFVITFDGPLDPSTAQNAANYRIVGPKGVVEPIQSAVYDASSMTVTLYPRQQLNLHSIYQITINGTTPTGLADLSGRLLDGAQTGQPGSNYTSVLNAAQLVLGSTVPGGPAQLAKLRRELAQIVANQAKQAAKTVASSKKAVSKAHAPSKPKVVHHASRSSTKVVSGVHPKVTPSHPTADHRSVKADRASRPSGRHKSK